MRITHEGRQGIVDAIAVGPRLVSRSGQNGRKASWKMPRSSSQHSLPHQRAPPNVEFAKRPMRESQSENIIIRDYMRVCKVSIH